MGMAVQAWRCIRCGAEFTIRIGWCSGCGTYASVLPAPMRRLDAWVPEAPLRPASEVYRLAGRWLKLPEWLEAVVGRLPASGPWLGIVSGPPGSGKTRLMLSWADWWASEVGRTVYLAQEEALPSLGQRLRQAEIANENLYVGSTQGIEALLDAAREAAGLFIDSASASYLTGADLSRIAADVNAPVVASLHVTKDGAPAGRADLLHAADVHLHLPERGKFETRKQRFSGELREGVLP